MQIIGVGMATVDILIRLDEMPNWNTAGPLCDLAIDGGGPVGTGLVAAARLGARTGYIGTCGCDEIARLKMSLLTREGVDASRTIPSKTPELQVVLVYIQEQTGERIFACRNGIDEPLILDASDRDYITSADYLHIDGFYFEAALQAAEWMHSAGKQVMFDASKVDRGLNEDARSRAAALVRATDLLICGSGFAQALSGSPERWEALEAMRALGPHTVVQTDGENGCYTLTAGDRFHTPAFQVPVVDTTGAGDVFHGAYLVGLLRGWDLRRTAIFATAVSALKCTHLGGRVGIPSYNEVVAFLLERGMDICNPNP